MRRCRAAARAGAGRRRRAHNRSRRCGRRRHASLHRWSRDCASPLARAPAAVVASANPASMAVAATRRCRGDTSPVAGGGPAMPAARGNHRRGNGSARAPLQRAAGPPPYRSPPRRHLPASAAGAARARTRPAGPRARSRMQTRRPGASAARTPRATSRHPTQAPGCAATAAPAGAGTWCSPRARPPPRRGRTGRRFRVPTGRCPCRTASRPVDAGAVGQSRLAVWV
jgi:hypothetical protein